MKNDITSTVEATPKQLKNVLLMCYKAGIVPLVLGPVGIGKSSIAKDLADDLGYALLDTRLSYKSPTDVQGFARVNSNERMVYATPDEYPDADSTEKGFVWHLDEFTCSNKWTQNASLQLILDRRVGQYEVPKNVFLMLSGNGKKDGAFVQAVSAAVANRLCIIKLRASTEEWLEWAVGGEDVDVEDKTAPQSRSRIHPLVSAFITIHTDELSSTLDITKWDGESGFASPRSWERVSDYMFAEDSHLESGGKVDHSTRQLICQGLVGGSSYFKFSTFLNLTNEIPDPRKVLDSRSPASLMPDTKEKRMVLLLNMLPLVQSMDDIDKFFTNVLPTFPTEMRVFAGVSIHRGMTKANTQEILKSVQWMDFFLDNADAIIPSAA